MNKYRRIKYEDRCQIYALSKRGSSQESIAGEPTGPNLPHSSGDNQPLSKVAEISVFGEISFASPAAVAELPRGTGLFAHPEIEPPDGARRAAR
jgi:hypothetical protein